MRGTPCALYCVVLTSSYLQYSSCTVAVPQLHCREAVAVLKLYCTAHVCMCVAGVQQLYCIRTVLHTCVCSWQEFSCCTESVLYCTRVCVAGVQQLY